MSLFGAIIKTAVNITVLPIAVVSDIVTLGGIMTETPSAILKQIEKLKEEADDTEGE